MLYLDKTEIFSHIIDQHLTEASFLWTMRARAMHQAHHTKQSIHTLETRLVKHLTGLLNYPDSAWIAALEATETQDAGDFFVLCFLALHSAKQENIQHAIVSAAETEDTFKALISASGWQKNKVLHPMLAQWVKSDSVQHRRLAIAACSVKRIDPRDYLNRLLLDEKSLDDVDCYCRMLRLIGELKRFDLMPALKIARRHPHNSVVFWACWSSLLLGDKSALVELQPFVFDHNPYQTQAIEIAFKCLPVARSWIWIADLVKQPKSTALTIAAIASLGDPKGINWLLQQMENKGVAKLALEAFCRICGCDPWQLAAEDQRTDKVDTADFPDENILDFCESLPFPDTAKASVLWQQTSAHFQTGRRYLLGHTVDAGSLNQRSATVRQTCRVSAALEYSLLSDAHKFINVKAPQAGLEQA